MKTLTGQFLNDDQNIKIFSGNLVKKSKSSERNVYDPSQRIEQQLLLKYVKSQAKISRMRLKQQRDEAKMVQKVPVINKTSREIVGLLEGKGEKSASGYATRVVSRCRSSLGFMMHPKHSFISLADLNIENLETEPLNYFHKKTESQKNPQLSSTIVLKNSNKEEKNKEQIAAQKAKIEDLKRIVASRRKAEDSQPAPEPLYEMGVLARNQFWLDRKNQRLQMKQEEKITEETKNCTFTPTLAPKVSIDKVPRPSSQSSKSYAKKNKMKNFSSTCVKIFKQPKEITVKPRSSLRYKALAPQCKTVRKSASVTLFKNAVPMLPYNT